MRQCSVCKIDKSFSSFTKGTCKDGYSSWCKECKASHRRNHYEANKEQYLKNNVEYRENNIDKVREWHCKEYKRNKIKYISRAKIYSRMKCASDIQFKLAKLLRTRVYQALKGKVKIGSAVSDLGCSVEELKEHIEKQFKPGMTWNNWGNKTTSWSLDHIKPISSFNLTDRQQFLEANNYRNLQPLWHVDNIRKSNTQINMGN